jgi:hypothetical protein
LFTFDYNNLKGSDNLIKYFFKISFEVNGFKHEIESSKQYDSLLDAENASDLLVEVIFKEYKNVKYEVLKVEPLTGGGR